jgi:hypothetical protein
MLREMSVLGEPNREVAKEFPASDRHEDHEPPERSASGRNDTAAPMIRDRVKALRRVLAKELLANPKNWRRHPKAQTEALRGLLAEVGYADALLARELPDG